MCHTVLSSELVPFLVLQELFGFLRLVDVDLPLNFLGK